MEPSQEHDPWVIRTDFSEDEQWKAVCDLISAPQDSGFGDEFFAYVNFVSEKRFRNVQPTELVLSLPDEYNGMFCFIVDQQCIEDPEHPVLVVGFYPSDEDLDNAGDTHDLFSRSPCDTPLADIAMFRALPSQIQAIENNLSLSNMDFDDFAGNVDDDGVLRG